MELEKKSGIYRYKFLGNTLIFQINHPLKQPLMHSLCIFLYTLIISIIPRKPGNLSSASQYQCKNTDITPEERLEALYNHNSLRSQLAIGGEGYEGRFKFPTGANINKLKYSCQLETEAQQAAEEMCKTGQVTESTDRNVLMKKSSRDDFEIWLTVLVDWWSTGSDEYAELNGNSLNYTKEMAKTNASSFARMANGATVSLGCGLKTGCGSGSDDLIFTCKYSPSVQVGKLLYEAGEPCSKCTGSCDQTEKLCITN